MISNSDIRAKALDTLEHRLFGNVWITLIVVNFVYSVIVGFPGALGNAVSRNNTALLASVGTIFTLLSVLVKGPMEYGFTRVLTNVARNKKKADIKDLFDGYREAVTESVVLGLLRSVFIVLWGLLFIIPGIIKAYSYSMAMFIQQDSEDKNWRSCLDRSQQMMQGNKGRLFLLDLSFIGWYIVGALCLGIGIIWVAAYHSVARAHFYEELRREQGLVPEETEESPQTEEETFRFEEKE